MKKRGRALFFHLSIQCLCTTNDVDKFVGDDVLTGLVVLDLEFLRQLVGIVGCDVHGSHAGAMFGCQCIQHDGVEIGS